MALEDLGTGLGALVGSALGGLGEAFQTRQEIRRKQDEQRRGLKALQTDLGLSDEQVDQLSQSAPQVVQQFVGSQLKRVGARESAAIKAGSQNQEVNKLLNKALRIVDSNATINSTTAAGQQVKALYERIAIANGAKSKAQIDAFVNSMPGLNENRSKQIHGIRQLMQEVNQQNQIPSGGTQQPNQPTEPLTTQEMRRQEPGDEAVEFIQNTEPYMTAGQPEIGMQRQQQLAQLQQQEPRNEQLSNAGGQDFTQMPINEEWGEYIQRVGSQVANNVAQGALAIPELVGSFGDIAHNYARNNLDRALQYIMPEGMDTNSPEYQETKKQIADAMDKLYPGKSVKNIKNKISNFLGGERYLRPENNFERFLGDTAKFVGNTLGVGSVPKNAYQGALYIARPMAMALAGESAKDRGYGAGMQMAAELGASILVDLSFPRILNKFGITDPLNANTKTLTEAATEAVKEAKNSHEQSIQKLNESKNAAYRQAETMGNEIPANGQKIAPDLQNLLTESENPIRSKLSEKGQAELRKNINKTIQAINPSERSKQAQQLAQQGYSPDVINNIMSQLPEESQQALNVSDLIALKQRLNGLGADADGALQRAYYDASRIIRDEIDQAAKNNPDFLSTFASAETIHGATQDKKTMLDQLADMTQKLTPEMQNRVEEVLNTADNLIASQAGLDTKPMLSSYQTRFAANAALKGALGVPYWQAMGINILSEVTGVKKALQLLSSNKAAQRQFVNMTKAAVMNDRRGLANALRFFDKYSEEE